MAFQVVQQYALGIFASGADFADNPRAFAG
jgi:hypothetical protein